MTPRAFRKIMLAREFVSTGTTGVKMDTTTLASPPTEGQYVKVTAISGVDIVGLDFIRLLRPRRDADIVVYP